MNKKKLLPSLAFAALSLTLFASSARGDILPPENEACENKTAGAGCRLNDANGVCEAKKCTRPDYGNWNRDASASPPSIQVDCLKCVVGGSAPDGGAPGDDKDDSSGCAVGGPGARAAGPWLLAGAFSLLLLRRRRK
jgi:MYXO-CTERM domain-containing protein